MKPHLLPLGLALLTVAFAVESVIANDKRPNVVIVLADDLGYGDVRCYNQASKIPTPHLDRLAASGLRFTDAHTPSSVCTPTRYTLLTGRYCCRSRLKSGVLDGFSPPLIEPGQPTIATLLKNQGYATACLGKWHLGMQWTRRDNSPETNDRGKERGFRSGADIDFSQPIMNGPCTVGFDTFFGISASLDMPPYCWIENDRCRPAPDTVSAANYDDLFMNQPKGAAHSEFHLDAVLPTLKQRAINWLDTHFNRVQAQPFFLYLPLPSPHLPIVPSPRFLGTSEAGRYGDYVAQTDDFVGAIVDALTKHRVLENTLLVVTSDNGGLWHLWTPQESDDLTAYRPTVRGRYTAKYGHFSNGQWRGTKADIYEGGHRVPFIVHWPQVIESGKVIDQPIELTDLFATVADAVGLPLPDKAAPDSFSFARALGVTSGPQHPTRTVIIHHSLRGVFGIRKGRWKYVESRGSGGFSTPNQVKPQPGELTGQLYDLQADPQETRNVFQDHPAIVESLQRQLNVIRASTSMRDVFRDESGMK